MDQRRQFDCNRRCHDLGNSETSPDGFGGGMGGIGYVLAKHLLTKYDAKVALMGRTVLPGRERWEEWITEHGSQEATSRRILRARELEESGGELMLLSADVADEAAMTAALVLIEERLGPIHGVIHAAGLPGGARIAAQDPGSAADVLRSKVQGSQVLAKLLVGRNLDFVFFCSSISAVLPIAGASAYAAANSFLDRYATWCRQNLGLPAVSVNFDAWQEVGMAADLETAADFEADKAARLRLAMTPEEGIEVIERVLASGESRMLVSTVDFPTVLANAFEFVTSHVSVTAAKSTETASSETLDQTGPLSRETLAVMAIWKELLGAESVEPEDNFFELGGHSLLGTMVLSRVREQFGAELGLRSIFDFPTPLALGAKIREVTASTILEADDSVLEEADAVAVHGDREEFEF